MATETEHVDEASGKEAGLEALFPTFARVLNRVTDGGVERIALVVLILWSLLPTVVIALSAAIYPFTSANGATQEAIQLGIKATYTMAFGVLGVLTLVIGVFMLLCLLLNSSNQILQKARRYPWLVLLAVLLVWAFVCAALSGHFDEEWGGTWYRNDGLMSYLMYAAVVVCAFLLRSPGRRMTLLRVFSLAANVLALLMLLQTFNVGIVNDVYPFSMSGVFFNTNHAAYYLLMTLLTLVGLFLYDRQWRWQIAYGVSLFLQMFALAENDTFGCIVALWLTLIFVYAVYVTRGEKKSGVLAVPVVCLAVPTIMCSSSIVTDILTLIEDIFNISIDFASKDSDSAGSGRLKLWKFAAEQIVQHPIFGLGPEGLSFVVPEGMIDRPHNEYIQYAAFFGLPGAALYLSSLVTLAVNKMRRVKTLAPATVVIAGVIVGYAISACFGNTEFYTTPYFFMMIGLVSLRNE